MMSQKALIHIQSQFILPLACFPHGRSSQDTGFLQAAKTLHFFWRVCQKHVRKGQTCCFLTPFPSLQAAKVKCGPEKRAFMRDPCEALSLCLPPQRHKYKTPYSSSLMFRSVQKYARACLHSCEKALMVTSNPILNRSPQPPTPNPRIVARA